MVKEIKITEDYTTVGVFNEMKVGDRCIVPYTDSRHLGIAAEAARRNKAARLQNKLKYRQDLMFRVSKVDNVGYTTIIKIK